MFFTRSVPHLNVNKRALRTCATSYITMSTSRSIAKAVYARETPEGVGAIVRRSIGSPALKNLSPFLMSVISLLIANTAPLADV